MALLGNGVQPPLLEVGEKGGVSPPTRSRRQGLLLPNLAWKLKIAGAVYGNTRVSCGAGSRDDGINVSNVLRVISFELPCAYFKHLNDHPRFLKTVSQGFLSLPLPVWPPHGKATGGAALDGVSSAASARRGAAGAALNPRIKGD